MTTKLTFKDKTFPIMAGMQFAYPNTINNKIHKVGSYTVRFWYNEFGQLVKEKTIKRVIK